MNSPYAINQNCTNFWQHNDDTSLYDKSVRGGYGDLFMSLQQTSDVHTVCFFFSLANNFLCPFSGYVFVTRVFSFIYFSNERNHLSAKFTTACTAYWKGRITPVLLRNGMVYFVDSFFFLLYIFLTATKNTEQKNTYTHQQVQYCGLQNKCNLSWMFSCYF